MSLLRMLLGGRKAVAIGSLCASALAAALTLWWNNQLAEIINAASAGIAPTGAALALAVFAMLAMGAAAYIKAYVSNCAGESIAHDLRVGYARHFMSLSAAEAERCNAGEQLSKLQNEITAVTDYLSGNLQQLVDDCVRFFATLGWLLLQSPTVTLAANLPVFGLMAYVLWSSKAIGAATEGSQRAKEKMNRHAETLVSLFPIVRLYDAARMALHGYSGAVAAWEAQSIRAERTRARLMSLSALLSCIPLLLLFLVGGGMVLRGALSLGTLYVFINLSGNVSGALMNMPGHIAAFRRFCANMDRLSPHVRLVEKGGRV